jgi:hypothetical protein
VAHHISFPDYTLEELTTIAEVMLREQKYSFDDEARGAFVEYLELRMKQPQFANARSVRNAIDRIKLRQASRLVSGGGRIGREQLARIAASDVRQSRVFQGGLEGDAEAGSASGRQPLRSKETQ